MARIAELPACIAGLMIAFAMGAAPAAAQDTSSAAMAPGSDSDFVAKAGSGGMAEVRLGKLAQQKGSSAEVKQFGERMVTDHTKANQELTAAAGQAGLAPPSILLPKEQRTASKLSTKSGSGFDKAYMAEMVKDHTEDIRLFQHEARSGRAESLKQVAANTLPTLREHLQMAKQVAAKVGADTTGMSSHAEQASGTR
jgi:putative membrane protein